MATVDIASTPPGEMQSWTNAAARSVPPISSSAPISRVVFSDAVTIPIKDAANETRMRMTATLPRNFFYRVSELELTLLSDAVDVFTPATGFELAALVNINEGGAVINRFPMYNQLNNLIGADAVKIDVDATTQDFGTFFVADPANNISKFFIDATTADATLRITLMDTSADATAAVELRWRATFMMYTVDQSRDWPSNSPTLIY